MIKPIKSAVKVDSNATTLSVTNATKMAIVNASKNASIMTNKTKPTPGFIKIKPITSNTTANQTSNNLTQESSKTNQTLQSNVSSAAPQQALVEKKKRGDFETEKEKKVAEMQQSEADMEQLVKAADHNRAEWETKKTQEIHADEAKRASEVSHKKLREENEALKK